MNDESTHQDEDGNPTYPGHMAHPNMRVSFANLRNTAMRVRNFHVRMNIFECGNYVEVTRDGVKLYGATWRCGDAEDKDASSQVANWLIANRYLRVVDFDGD